MLQSMAISKYQLVIILRIQIIYLEDMNQCMDTIMTYSYNIRIITMVAYHTHIIQMLIEVTNTSI